MISDIAKSACKLWNLNHNSIVLCAKRENYVYKVLDNNNASFALRIHRKGYNSEAELISEIKWILELRKNKQNVPNPITSLNKNLLENVEGYNVSLLGWINGIPMSEISYNNDDSEFEHFRLLGNSLAVIHTISDNWKKPEKFVRKIWDLDGLLGTNPVWDKFWENPLLKKNEKEIMIEARKKAFNQLLPLKNLLDYGLIHADAVMENVLIDKGKVNILDFDDSGFGYRLFDLSTILFSYEENKNYKIIKEHLLKGYLEKRKIDLHYLNTFMLLRAFTYVGWIISRINEENGIKKNKKNIRLALKHSESFLEKN